MTDDVELLAAQKLFAIGVPGARQRISGRFAAAGSIQQAAGIYPQVEVRGYKSFTEFDAISARKSRTAVNSLVGNALSKQGKGLNTYLSSANNQSVFRKLGSTPHRIALNAVESNNAIDKNEAMMQYLELVVPYVNEHAGGIIGDAIKEEYFQAGRNKWAPLHPNTIESKRRRGYPRPGIPLFGTTFTATLPDGWYAYTYRWGNFHAGGKPIKYALTHPRASLADTRKYLSVYMASKEGQSSALRSQSGFFTEPYKMTGNREGTVAYPPEMRGAALMDVVANLQPTAQVIRPYPGRGYQAALKASAEAKEPSGQAQMKVDNILQPIALIAPYAFYHEEGRGNNPKRPFMTPGLSLGMGRVEQLFEVYLKEGAKNFRKAYQETDVDGLRDMNEIEALYERGADEAADLVRISKFMGKRGLGKLPRHAKFDHSIDVPVEKHRTLKGLMRRLFGNHLVWWFVPPSKYWHYIGMASDIYGLLYGKKNMGAAIAYIKAMTIGLAGARAGSPVPFTRKARRRKFRQNLYTRAGYHRTQVGGSR